MVITNQASPPPSSHFFVLTLSSQNNLHPLSFRVKTGIHCKCDVIMVDPLVSVRVLPDDKVEVWEGEHDDAEEGGEGAVEDRRQHVLQCQHHATLTAPDTRDETLKQKKILYFCYIKAYKFS